MLINKKTKLLKQKRPPVVTVLGHVDHGKTTLLDTIRKADIASGESGGITQHIGAYQVQLDPKDTYSKITFIDTPGHQAFSKMRSRGAKVADIAILIIAANDGVKPQTKEAIKHIKEAGVPFIVAINKIDLDGVNLDIVKAQLAENDVIVEDYGGDIISVNISAKNNKNINQLLEMINLLYEMEEEDKNFESDNHFSSVVMESYVDPQIGPIANILIRSGSLKVGDYVYCGNEKVKVKNIINDKGEMIIKAEVSQPVQILGFKKILEVGSIVSDVKNYKISKENDSIIFEENVEDDKKLNIILKADVAGTLEALKSNLSDEVVILHEGVGDISESDVLLARSTGARLIGFHVRIPNVVKKLAKMEKIKIYTFDVIYHLLEDLEKRVLRLIEPTINEQVLGTAEIIAEFNIKKSHIAGCNVIDGVIHKTSNIRITRGDNLIGEVKIKAMQLERKDVVEVKKNQEVALVFRPDVKFKIGDKLLSYNIIDE